LCCLRPKADPAPPRSHAAVGHGLGPKAVDAAFAAGMNAKDTAAVFAVYAADSG
jgi:hypothetical protein